MIMNQRNALLKEIFQKNASADILDIWDRQAAHEGAVISFMRNEYIGKINGICGRLYETISGGKEKLELEYKSNVYKREDFEKPCGRLLSSITRNYAKRASTISARVRRIQV